MAADTPDRPWGGRTLVVQVTVATVVCSAATLVTAAVVLLRLQESSSLEHLDEVLSDEAEAVGAAVGAGEPVPRLLDDDRVLLVLDADGGVVASQGPASELGRRDIVTADDRGVDVTFAGEVHRVVAESYVTADGGLGTVLLAEPRDELDDTLAWLERMLLVLVPGSLLVLGFVVARLGRRTMRPVEQLRRDVTAIDTRSLGHRVTVPSGDDGIVRLAKATNKMLARVERSARRQQRFVADASHELRTPLTRMRAEVEADALDPEHADPVSSRESLLVEIEGLQRMIDNMLVLARSDAGDLQAADLLVDLDDIVLEELRAIDPARPVRANATDVSAAQVRGSPDDLRRLVRNLLDNAGRHATSAIAVSLTETDREAVLAVDDDGPGIPEERREEVFERFRRLDRSIAEPGHAGLGLPIVSEIAERHGGSVLVDDSPLGGARFTVTLPRADPA